ncbi:hypothetical protein LZS85_15490 [Aliivibrio fischeri]|uniref:hypothetical protein n=1 Tax=Aliivibrio fischeri TaxID=668 RepID=UPI001F32F845|nr:hypothetical protein [Aliivibrio fischeri]MCE7567526.1 hypothetical protein [Aliivibrio fischeri]
MADIVGSFSRGLDLGNKVVNTYQGQQDRERNLERQKTLEGREDTLWDQSQSDYQQGLKDKEQAKKEHEEDRSRLKVVQGREDTTYKQQQEEYSYAKKERQRALDDRLVQTLYQNILSTGRFPAELDPATKGALDRNPLLRESLFNSDNQAYVTGVLATTNVMKRLSAGDLPDERDPEMLTSANFLLMDLIKSGDLPSVVAGQNVVNREISDITSTPQGYAITQKITLENGEVIEKPVTLNRSEREDDPVMTIKPEVLVERFKKVAEAQQLIPDNLRGQYSEFYRLHWGDPNKKTKGKGSSRSGGRSGSGNGDDSNYTKEYMADETAIQSDYNKRIAEVESDMMLDEDEKRQRINSLEQQKDKALNENKESWSQFTTVNDPDVGKQKKIKAANQIVTGISRQYADYDIGVEDKAQIRELLLNGDVGKDEINAVIESMIKSGEIKRKGSADQEENASSIMGSYKENEVKANVPALEQDAWGNQVIPPKQPSQTGLADR